MRCTLKMSANTTINNINTNYLRMTKLIAQLGTGQRVLNLSDDPLAANVGIRMDTMIARTTQYNRSIKTGTAFLGLTDNALGQAKSLLDKVKSLVIAGANEGGTTPQMRASMASEVASALQEILSLANSFDGSRYLFGGTQTLIPPYEVIADRYVRYLGNGNPLQIEVDSGSFHAVNIAGDSAFGRLTGQISSRAYAPALNLGVGTSTRLADLNGGDGVPKGSIRVYYSAYPNGVDIDVSGCDTLEDLADFIARETRRLSALVGPADPGYNPDCADRYLELSLNADHSGLSLREMDGGGLHRDLSGNPLASSAAGPTQGAVRVANVGMNRVADALGISGASDAKGVLAGLPITPRLSAYTLLADLDGYRDHGLAITNGALPGAVRVEEATLDVNNVFNQWNLDGLVKGSNTGDNGELYAKITRMAGSSLSAGDDTFAGAVIDVNHFDRAADAPDGRLYFHCVRLAGGETRVEAYKDAARTQLLASGTADAFGHVARLERADDAALSIGSLDLNPAVIGAAAGDKADFALSVDPASSALRDNPVTDNWGLIGLSSANTGPARTLYTETVRQADGTVRVNVYKDDAMGQLVASGVGAETAPGSGVASVVLSAVGGSGLSGGVTVDLAQINNSGDRAVQRLTAGLEEPDILQLEIYRKPVNQALGGDLVATAASSSNGTFVLQEANHSGVSGTVGVNLQPNPSTRELSATVDLTVYFDPTFRDSISVPAFEEPVAGQPGYDAAGMAAGWSLLGLEKAAAGYIPANGVDPLAYYNQHASTDPSGNLDVVIRRSPDGNGYEIQLYRPEFSYTYQEGYPPAERRITVPSTLVARGFLADPASQGRVEIRGAPGFEGITGSVALELPPVQTYSTASGALANAAILAGDQPLTSAYVVGTGQTLTLPKGTTLPIGATLGVNTVLPKGTVLPAGLTLPGGGATDGRTPLAQAMTLTQPMVLTAETTLPDACALGPGSVLPAERVVGADGARAAAGTVLYPGATLAAGSTLSAGSRLPGGTALPAGNKIAAHNTLPAGTVLGGDTLLAAGTRLPTGQVLVRDAYVRDLGLPGGQLTLTSPWTLEADIALGSATTLGGDFTANNELVLAGALTVGPGPLTLAADARLAPGSRAAWALPAGTGFAAGAAVPDGSLLRTGDAPVNLAVKATFATVQDLMNEVNGGNLYARMVIGEDRQSLTIASELAGAWLQVAEAYESVERMGDTYEQLSGLNLSGLLRGVNTDANYGLYAEVAHYPEDLEIIHVDGRRETIAAGYYVRFYDSASEVGLDYRNRDPARLMAQAYVAPADYAAGDPLVIRAMNDSGLSGSVRLDYQGARTGANTDDSTITVYPGGLRSRGTGDLAASQMDIYGIQPGLNATYDGGFYAEAVRDGLGIVTVRLYRDASRTYLVAEGAADAQGRVTLAERNGSRLSGSLWLGGELPAPGPDGESRTTFEIFTGDSRQTGRVREENVFSTLADITDAMYAQDAEWLHDLIAEIEKDINRLIEARGDAGARMQRLELLYDRHLEEIQGFTTIKTDRMDLDYSEAIVRYQLEQNIYDAALKVAGQFLPLSLIDYLR